ncbi:MAG: hypothetical protein U0746_16490 [Gemmataceae bacterium]
MLFCQIAIATGHQTRLTSVNHGLAEIWSNQFDKWIVLDVELNHHFEKGGMPLNMAELLDENFVPGPTQVRPPRRGNGGRNPTMAHLKVPELTATKTVPFKTNLILVDRETIG